MNNTLTNTNLSNQAVYAGPVTTDDSGVGNGTVSDPKPPSGGSGSEGDN